MKKNGFTLIELLAVIVIMGILALIIVPIVSNYIAQTRKDTYVAHETTMREAAKSYTIECINGTDTCVLPPVGQTHEVYLNELIDKSYAQRLQNPQGDGYCNSNLSYVRITNTGNSNFEYEVCLYCGNYVSENELCASLPTDDDRIPPTCGTIEGQSSEWTNKSRTISVGCTDQGGSGCLRNRFTQTFTATTNKSEIQITDRSGNTKECEVSVKVDKTAPTCELQVLDATDEANGWVSGPVKVRFKAGSRKDNESGVFTWGIGTSVDNVDYNRQELIDLTNINGVVTVIGYVKDNAGNEGTCSLNLRTGVQRPAFDIYYGYQVFPVKELHTDSGLTVEDNNVVKTSSTNPTMTFNNMNKYTNAVKAVIVLNSATSEPTEFKLTLDDRTTISARPMDSNKRLEFDIPRGTYNKYSFKFGKNSNATYTVMRMEIQHTDNDLYTSKPVTVDLYPDMSREKVKTNGYSFDSGRNFQVDYFKQFNSTTTEHAQTKNDIPMYSDKKQFNVNVHTDPPVIDNSASGNAITYNPTEWTNGNVIITARGIDRTAGLVAYGFSKTNSLGYDDPGWTSISLTKNTLTRTHEVSTNGTYYYNLKSESGLTANKSVAITNIDKIKPVCSVTDNSKVICTDSGDTDYGVSKINSYKFTTSNSTVGTYTPVSSTARLETVHNITASGTYYLFATDNAGNISNVVYYKYHKVSYDCNGGTPTATYDTYVRENTPILSNGNPVNGTPSCSKTGYTFVGWSTNNKATSKTTSLDMSTSDVTLYAVWSINSPGTPTISGGTTKIYGTTDTSLTCSESTQYSSETSKYFEFGYSTTDGGTPSNWVKNTESATATSSTYVIGKTSYFGNRYWSCRVSAGNSYLSSSVQTSSSASDQLVSYKNATVTFNANGGTVSGTSPLYTRSGQTGMFTTDLGSTAGTVPGATRSCYDFAGWYTATSAGSQILTSGKALSSATVNGYIGSSKWTLTENKTLYAQWNHHTYSITYDYAGGSAPTPAPASSYVHGTGTTVSGTPSRNGYTFNGWIMDNSTAFSHTISNTACANKTVTAKWCANCNPGANASCTLNASTPGTCSYSTGCSAHYHYSSGNSTATPACTIDTHTLTYNSDGGSACTAKTANYGSTWGTLCSPTKQGYSFKGWYSGSTKITSNSTVSGNVSVKASWEVSTIAPTVTLYRFRGRPSGTCGTAEIEDVMSTVCTTCTGSTCPCVIQALYISPPSSKFTSVTVTFNPTPSGHSSSSNTWTTSDGTATFYKYTYFSTDGDKNNKYGEVGVGTKDNFFTSGNTVILRFRNENGTSGISGKVTVKYANGATGEKSFSYGVNSSGCCSSSKNC